VKGPQTILEDLGGYMSMAPNLEEVVDKIFRIIYFMSSSIFFLHRTRRDTLTLRRLLPQPISNVILHNFDIVPLPNIPYDGPHSIRPPPKKQGSLTEPGLGSCEVARASDVTDGGIMLTFMLGTGN
jgi:hypothetical protein